MSTPALDTADILIIRHALEHLIGIAEEADLTLRKVEAIWKAMKYGVPPEDKVESTE